MLSRRMLSCRAVASIILSCLNCSVLCLWFFGQLLCCPIEDSHSAHFDIRALGEYAFPKQYIYCIVFQFSKDACSVFMLVESFIAKSVSNGMVLWSTFMYSKLEILLCTVLSNDIRMPYNFESPGSEYVFFFFFFSCILPVACCLCLCAWHPPCSSSAA